LIIRLDKKFPELKLHVWYLDDGGIAPIPILGHILAFLREEGKVFGFEINLGKCEVRWPSLDLEAVDAHIPQEVQQAVIDGIMLVGGPVGGANTSRAIVASHMNKIAAICEQLVKLQDSEVALTLLCSCVGFPKMSFALRTTFPEFVAEEYRRFDEEMYKVLSAIAGCNIPAMSLIQANLLPALGGLGVPSAIVLGSAAFLASPMQSLALQVEILGQNFASLVPRNCLAPLLSSINGSLKPPTAPLEMGAISKHANPQELISSVIHTQSDARLLAQANPRKLARLNSV
jgi:hypothetical protein